MELPPDRTTLDDILAVVLRERGVDFRAYRRSTIERRVAGRMALVRASSYADYRQLLAEAPGEVDRLVERLTIKVSRFYRDSHVFEMLREKAIPELRARRAGAPLRFWSAGCGNGEEVYSLALVARELGIAPATGVVICGTDVDPAALAFARAARYAAEALVDLPAALVDTGFCVESGGARPAYVVRDALRPGVEFLQHDLTTAREAPHGWQYDLVCCRNVLIYFDRAPRERVQHLLCESLAPGGWLCLGEAEWLQSELRPRFEVMDRKARLFRRVG